MLARAVPLVLLGVGAVYLFLATNLPFGSTARPGAGFYPVVVGIFAVLVALGATISAFRTPRAVAAGPALDAGARRRVLVTMGTLAGFCLALPWIGYPPAAFAFVAVVLRVLGSGWTAALVIGALSAAGSYALFAGILDVPLPRGPW